jgi:hypothetical protein
VGPGDLLVHEGPATSGYASGVTLTSTEPLEARAAKGSYEGRKRFPVKRSKTPEPHYQVEELSTIAFYPVDLPNRNLSPQILQGRWTVRQNCLADGPEWNYERKGRAEAQNHSTWHMNAPRPIITRKFGFCRGEAASFGPVMAYIATGQPPKVLDLREQTLVIAGAALANYARPQNWLRRP